MKKFEYYHKNFGNLNKEELDKWLDYCANLTMKIDDFIIWESENNIGIPKRVLTNKEKKLVKDLLSAKSKLEDELYGQSKK